MTDERRALLAAFRPLPRPGTLVESDERARLSGLSREELADLRPLARPQEIVEETSDSAPTDLAVTASVVPIARPSNLPAAIESAVQEAVASAPRSSVPTDATVAQAATVQNGIALNRVALIGVYGSTGKYRALVRLQTGRFVMVTVGDRLDGGRVAAISSNSLIYAKSGRNYELEVPEG